MPPPRGTWNPIEGPGDYTTTKKVHNDTYPEIDPLKADLSGQAVFISGGSKGFGKAIAFSFAKAGTSYIAIGARSSLHEVAKEVKAAAVQAGRKEPKVLSLKLEVTDAKSVEDAFKAIETDFGRLDIVINNAGILGEHSKVQESNAEIWWQTMNINLRGPYLITRAALPLLLATNSGLKTLITISSVGALCVNAGLSAYQTSKLAVLRLTEFIAAENAEAGVVAFAVHPGNTLSDIVGRGEGMDENLKAVFTETPELVADGLVYLTKEKRDFLSGRYINITWDLPELTSETMRKRIVDGDLLKVKLAVPEVYP